MTNLGGKLPGSGGRWLGLGWLALWLVLGGCFLTGGIPGVHRPRWSARPHPGALSQPAGSALVHPTQAIENIRVGDRVLAGNPEMTGREAAPGDEVDPATWRRVELVMAYAGGGELELVLLRPGDWVQATGARAGRTVELAMPEMGVRGPARVVSVGRCPPIGPGPGRVVTGTFRHRDRTVLDVAVEGLAEPIGCTAAHPFWSVDRQRFVAAADLKLGERLQSEMGIQRIRSIRPRPGSPLVYNIEVATEHVYHVSDLGILVHNQYGRTAPVRPPNPEVPRPTIETRLPDRVATELPAGEIRTPAENAQARNFFERNRDAAREWWEQREGQDWPANSTHDEHPRPIKEGGDPLFIEPGFEGPAKPHMDAGDFQRWGRMGGRPPKQSP